MMWRAISSRPYLTDPVLWRRYTSYLDHTVKVRVMSAAAHARATRNCPTSGETWAAAMRFAEVQAAPGAAEADPTSGLMEAALGSGLATAGDYLAVGSAQCNAIRPPHHPPHLQLSFLEL